MNQVLIMGLIGAFLGGGLGVLIATADSREGEIFIASNEPITENQVREKLQGDGWQDLQIIDQGRHLEIIGSQNGQLRKLMVDRVTGRLVTADDDDD